MYGGLQKLNNAVHSKETMRDLSCTSEVTIELLTIILHDDVLKLLHLLVNKREIGTTKGGRLAPFPGHHDMNHLLQIWKVFPEVICSQPTIAVWKRYRLECVNDKALQNQRLMFKELLIVH